jgi:transcriptional regulator with XRE-family HTH domain
MAVAGVGLAVVAMIVVALPVAAASSQPAPVLHRGGVGGGSSDQALADALGITLEELQAAEQTAYEAGIQQALDQGLITQAQADALKQRSGALGRMPRGFMGTEDIDSEALLAAALGISVDQLQSARLEAQDATLAQAVTDGRITQEQADLMKAQQAFRTYLDEQGFEGRLQALHEEALQQAVQAGVLTQAQADAILSSQDVMGGFGHHRLGGMGGMRGFGDMDGFHGRGGMRGFEMPDSTSPSLLRPGVELGPSL